MSRRVVTGRRPETDAAAAIEAAVREVHHPVELEVWSGRRMFCAECKSSARGLWPCRTITVLDRVKATVAAGGQ